MKVDGIKNYQTNFGSLKSKDNNQNSKNIDSSKSSRSFYPVYNPNQNQPYTPQPLGGLIAPPPHPKHPLPTIITPPYIPQPLGGLIAPPPRPKRPLPTIINPPLAGLISPVKVPVKRPEVTQPTTTAGIIAPPPDFKPENEPMITAGLIPPRKDLPEVKPDELPKTDDANSAQ